MPVATPTVFSALDSLAPLRLAGTWDNVGLIVDPGNRTSFARAFLTIDLTLTTLSEAQELEADLIIAYHPPIFAPLQRLRFEHPAEQLLIRTIQSKMTIYSPHTALDAADNGMAEWLADGFGEGVRVPIVRDELTPEVGGGRLVTLHEPLRWELAVDRLKTHLGLVHVRASRPERLDLVRTVAVCPGAGGSLFEKVPEADLLLTGEMRHHDVLSRRARGTGVILTDHTNTERGFLPLFAERLRDACPQLEVVVSRTDADPLSVV